MMPTKMKISAEIAGEMIAKNVTVEIPTGLKIFQNHNGLRYDKFHVFIAPTGVGKSTLARTMLVDFVRYNKNKKMLVWLSEETVEEFYEANSFSVTEYEDTEKCVDVVSERDLGENDGVEEIKKYIQESVEYYSYDLIVFDNITTSRAYMSTGFQNQTSFISWLKSLCVNKTAVYIVAHTGSHVNENMGRLLNENDVRDNKSLVNVAEFVYILHAFKVGERIFQVIESKKARNQEIRSKYIGLTYDPEKRIFGRDTYLDYKDFMAAYKQRNKVK